jgi:hypothetical protein
MTFADDAEEMVLEHAKPVSILDKPSKKKAGKKQRANKATRK